jgi:hypothetical protein
MHTFCINVLIQLQCLRQVSNIQVFILSKLCTCSFTDVHIFPSTRLLVWMHERNTIKLHVSKILPEDGHVDVRNMSKTL